MYRFNTIPNKILNESITHLENKHVRIGIKRKKERKKNNEGELTD